MIEKDWVKGPYLFLVIYPKKLISLVRLKIQEMMVLSPEPFYLLKKKLVERHINDTNKRYI